METKLEPISEIARRLGVSVQTVARWCARNPPLKSRKVRGRLHCAEADAREYAHKHAPRVRLLAATEQTVPPEQDNRAFSAARDATKRQLLERIVAGERLTSDELAFIDRHAPAAKPDQKPDGQQPPVVIDPGPGAVHSPRAILERAIAVLEGQSDLRPSDLQAATAAARELRQIALAESRRETLYTREEMVAAITETGEAFVAAVEETAAPFAGDLIKLLATTYGVDIGADSRIPPAIDDHYRDYANRVLDHLRKDKAVPAAGPAAG